MKEVILAAIATAVLVHLTEGLYRRIRLMARIYRRCAYGNRKITKTAKKECFWYGFCAAFKIPFHYSSRQSYREYPHLVAEMAREKLGDGYRVWVTEAENSFKHSITIMNGITGKVMDSGEMEKRKAAGMTPEEAAEEIVECFRGQ